MSRPTRIIFSPGFSFNGPGGIISGVYFPSCLFGWFILRGDSAGSRSFSGPSIEISMKRNRNNRGPDKCHAQPRLSSNSVFSNWSLFSFPCFGWFILRGIPPGQDLFQGPSIETSMKTRNNGGPDKRHTRPGFSSKGSGGIISGV